MSKTRKHRTEHLKAILRTLPVLIERSDSKFVKNIWRLRTVFFLFLLVELFLFGALVGFTSNFFKFDVAEMKTVSSIDES